MLPQITIEVLNHDEGVLTRWTTPSRNHGQQLQDYITTLVTEVPADAVEHEDPTEVFIDLGDGIRWKKFVDYERQTEAITYAITSMLGQPADTLDA